MQKSLFWCRSWIGQHYFAVQLTYCTVLITQPLSVPLEVNTYIGRYYFTSDDHTLNVFTGIVQSFFYLQVTTFWLLNIFALYWKIQFPFHARYYDTAKRTKYIHIACVVVAFVFPIIAPVTVSATGGFTITRFPPIVCLGRDADANFYTIVFPTTIIYAVGITVMLLILWRIRRVCYLL